MPNPFGNFNSIKVQLNVKCFNPRTHVGCDKNTEGCILVGEFQSTHPRRVRLTVVLDKLAFSGRFQSTHPRRVRLYHAVYDIAYLQFQSTHPRRVRPSCIAEATAKIVFQSTHPRRVRLVSTRLTRLERLFQSTHPRRVRLFGSPPIHHFGRVSIHAPT